METITIILPHAKRNEQERFKCLEGALKVLAQQMCCYPLSNNKLLINLYDSAVGWLMKARSNRHKALYLFKNAVNGFEVAIANFADKIEEAEKEEDRLFADMEREGFHSPEYLRSLASEHFKNLKAIAMRECGHLCMICRKNPGHLEFHHLHYLSLEREDPLDMEILCRPCHVKADEERVKRDGAFFQRQPFILEINR